MRVSGDAHVCLWISLRGSKVVMMTILLFADGSTKRSPFSDLSPRSLSFASSSASFTLNNGGSVTMRVEPCCDDSIIHRWPRDQTASYFLTQHHGYTTQSRVSPVCVRILPKPAHLHSLIPSTSMPYPHLPCYNCCFRFAILYIVPTFQVPILMVNFGKANDLFSEQVSCGLHLLPSSAHPPTWRNHRLESRR